MCHLALSTVLQLDSPLARAMDRPLEAWLAPMSSVDPHTRACHRSCSEGGCSIHTVERAARTAGDELIQRNRKPQPLTCLRCIRLQPRRPSSATIRGIRPHCSSLSPCSQPMPGWRHRRARGTASARHHTKLCQVVWVQSSAVLSARVTDSPLDLDSVPPKVPESVAPSAAHSVTRMGCTTVRSLSSAAES